MGPGNPQEGVDLIAAKIIDAAKPEAEWNNSYDLMLADLQTRFDPSLNAQKLVANGLRGEAYETVLQIQEAAVYIEASPQKVESWLTNRPSRLPFFGRGR